MHWPYWRKVIRGLIQRESGNCAKDFLSHNGFLLLVELKWHRYRLWGQANWNFSEKRMPDERCTNLNKESNKTWGCGILVLPDCKGFLTRLCNSTGMGHGKLYENQYGWSVSGNSLTIWYQKPDNSTGPGIRKPCGSTVFQSGSLAGNEDL